jgi:hypothetical protein
VVTLLSAQSRVLEDEDAALRLLGGYQRTSIEHAARISSYRQRAGTQWLLGSGVISAFITVHGAVMFCLSMRA